MLKLHMLHLLLQVYLKTSQVAKIQIFKSWIPRTFDLILAVHGAQWVPVKNCVCVHI